MKKKNLVQKLVDKTVLNYHEEYVFSLAQNNVEEVDEEEIEDEEESKLFLEYEDFKNKYDKD